MIRFNFDPKRHDLLTCCTDGVWTRSAHLTIDDGVTFKKLLGIVNKTGISQLNVSIHRMKNPDLVLKLITPNKDGEYRGYLGISEKGQEELYPCMPSLIFMLEVSNPPKTIFVKLLN
jgi:hypothetical protein